MKYLLIITTVLMSGFIGKKFANKYVQRDLFFKEIINFLNFIKSNISFKQTKILELFDEYNKICISLFKPAIVALMQIVINKDKNVINDDVFSFLTNEEKTFINKVFLCLGETGGVQECQKIEASILVLNNMSDEEIFEN